MNGHADAEAIAFYIREIREYFGDSLGVASDAPVFVCSAGRGSGEAAFTERVARAWGGEPTLGPAMIAAMGHQLVQVAGYSRKLAAADNTQRGGMTTLSEVGHAHAVFLREVCRAHSGNREKGAWGACWTGLTGEHALYLKLLFPRAKFIFLHHNPLQTFVMALRSVEDTEAVRERALSWAEEFAERWCGLVASFQLWHKEVDGILVGYGEVMADSPKEVEAYLGECLLAAAPRAESTISGDILTQLRSDEVNLLIERTEQIARRLGYALTVSAATASHRSAGVEPPLPAPHVHAEGVRISCAVLVPATRYIEPECDEALIELERRGCAVLRLRGCPSIDQGRNKLATLALEGGFEETLWIDADTGFDPAVVERLRSHRLPIVTGLYPRKNPGGGLAVAPMPGSRELVMGEGGGLVEVLYAGTGFMLVRREVYMTIRRRFNLPMCDEERPSRAIPFFMPMLEDWGGRMSYLGEDYAFCRRARLCGYKIMADTSIRLWHIGMYRYGYEDAGNEVQRVPTYRHVFESEDQRGA